MLMPSIFGENLFDDWMDFSFPSFDRDFYGNSSRSVMKTDVKETDKGYELDIELPGYQKEDVKAQLKDGYLTVQAVKNVNNDTKNEEGAYIRRERYAGTMSRSFYVGDNVTEADIQAKFENGVLKLAVPKKEAKKVEENKYIAIQ
ncbi:Hsp20/alpha crystallin family protein [Eubacterium sp. An3]|uniref:Hsp20/alpha crystallin family protein n=1 Tax=Eubacterium sp. An3 TaxID=1965628 RepID=UPI0007A7E0FF|nr:Hsp20/alpha crystallin family protein [Eubacterium sp. An3]OUO28873.1 heat-shock protein Hsp20 [Eubacterium sp. An3]CVI65920.1 putative Hsp20 family chaperone [Eubacteriaceae bacterium CHKCI004]